MMFGGDWKNPLRQLYLYVLYIMIIYALFVGIKMGDMLSQKQEISGLFKSIHTHTLCNSFLFLLLLYDLRIKNTVEHLNIPWGIGEIILGVGILGNLITTAGFSIAGIQPKMIGIGMSLLHIGEPLMLFSMLGYVITAILAEVYK